MCEFSGKLIAWLDCELPEAEAIKVEEHLCQCAECRRAIGSYQEISGAFLDCYVAAMSSKRAPRRWRWAAVGAAAAAAFFIAAVLARPRPQQLPAMPHAPHAPAIAFEKAPPRIVAVRATRHLAAPQPIRVQWVAVEPMVEVALPAEALFPPGAVPAGFTYIADIQP